MSLRSNIKHVKYKSIIAALATEQTDMMLKPRWWEKSTLKILKIKIKILNTEDVNYTLLYCPC